MEKYRQFADGGTGVNPFVPPWSNHKSSLLARAAKLLVLVPLAVIRLAILALALVWLLLAELTAVLIPLGLLRYPVYRVLTYVGCCGALFALGLVPLGDAPADHRRLKIAPPKTGGARVFNAPHGGIIIANQQGLTDVLYLCIKACPTFVFPASDGSPVRFGLLGALLRASARRLPPGPPCPAGLPDIAEWARSGRRGPVVVFPEGARTNGSCVLKWKPLTLEGLEGLGPERLAAVASLEYSKAGAYTPQHTVGTACRHLLWLCLQPWHTVRAVWLPEADVVAAARGKAQQERVALLRTVLARMTPGAVEVEVSCDRHPEFLAYWDASQRKRYTHQKKA